MMARLVPLGSCFVSLPPRVPLPKSRSGRSARRSDLADFSYCFRSLVVVIRAAIRCTVVTRYNADPLRGMTIRRRRIQRSGNPELQLLGGESRISWRNECTTNECASSQAKATAAVVRKIFLMPVEQLDEVDLMSVGQKHGHILLTISDHLGWSDTVEHQQALQGISMLTWRSSKMARSRRDIQKRKGGP